MSDLMPSGSKMSEGAESNTGATSDRVAQLENLLAKKDSQLSAVQQENKTLRASRQGANDGGANSGDMLLPPNAKPGECYARVLTPPTYRTTEKRVLKSPESERIEIVPPKYEMVTEKVLVKEASEEAVLVPAEYKWVTEKVLVSEPGEKIVSKPPVYKTVTEKVLVRPAYTTWKKGHGPIQKVDNATGEIMCLVEVPAEYKTISKRVLVEPARTEKVKIPGQYKEVKKRVMVEPPKMVKKKIPAEYKTIQVRKMVTPPQEKRIKIPAKYTTIAEREKVTDASLEWRPILCETNTTPQIIADLQRALDKKGYNPGPIDGVIGSETMAAVNAFQKDNKLASGQITLETLKALGIR